MSLEKLNDTHGFPKPLPNRLVTLEKEISSDARFFTEGMADVPTADDLRKATRGKIIPAQGQISTAPRNGRHRPAQSMVFKIGAILRKAQQHSVLWFHRSRQRQRLLSMDDRLLQDVGLSRYDAEQESQKWFWQG